MISLVLATSVWLVFFAHREIPYAHEFSYHDCQGFLALLGDKYLLWSQTRSAFIMFTTTPNFWIAMGDPVSESGDFAELLWQFREQADYCGAKTVFYQIGDELLPVYLDLRLSLYLSHIKFRRTNSLALRERAGVRVSTNRNLMCDDYIQIGRRSQSGFGKFFALVSVRSPLSIAR
jgi:hypothetical protein